MPPFGLTAPAPSVSLAVQKPVLGLILVGPRLDKRSEQFPPSSRSTVVNNIPDVGKWRRYAGSKLFHGLFDGD